MRLGASDATTLQTIRALCSDALNLDFAKACMQAHGAKAGLSRLYGKRVKRLASGDGLVVDRPISLAPPPRTVAKSRSSGRSGKSK